MFKIKMDEKEEAAGGRRQRRDTADRPICPGPAGEEEEGVAASQPLSREGPRPKTNRLPRRAVSYASEAY